jgi:hypothetical protein
MKKNTLLAALLILAAVLVPIPLALAQTEQPAVAPDVTMTLGWVVVSWVFYNVLGLVASLTSGESFDNLKFGRTLLVTTIVAIISLALKITPITVTTQYGAVLEIVVITILNTSPGLFLLYGVNKIWTTLNNLKARLQKARAAGSGAGPPKA